MESYFLVQLDYIYDAASTQSSIDTCLLVNHVSMLGKKTLQTLQRKLIILVTLLTLPFNCMR